MPIIIILALMAGLLYESKRICQKWSALFTNIGLALGLSQGFVLSVHDGSIPYPELSLYAFLSAFILVILITNFDKLVFRLNEATAVVQSIALIYLVVNERIFSIAAWWEKAIYAFAALFIVFAFLNALTQFKLSRLSRLILSVGSCLIVLAFSADNFYAALTALGHYPNASGYEKMLILLQFFFVGVSSVYVAHNVAMILAIFPIKDDHRGEYRERINTHVTRYRATHPVHAAICALVAAMIFLLNYKFMFAPHQLAIWFAFVLTSFIIGRIDIRTRDGY